MAGETKKEKLDDILDLIITTAQGLKAANQDGKIETSEAIAMGIKALPQILDVAGLDTGNS